MTGTSADATPPSTGTGPPLARADWLALGAILAVALLLRLLNLQQIHANDPFFELPSPDPRLYHEWATRIAEGDWLGEGVFLQGPLYPYLLGVVYRVFGPGFLLPRVLQCLLGVLTCAFTWALARELFGRREAVLAGLGAATYSMFIFYEGSLLIANILLPISVLLLLLAVRWAPVLTPNRSLILGVLVGLAALARPNMLLYAPLALLWILWAAGAHPWRQRLGLALALGLGVLVCVGPSAMRNYRVSGDFVLVSASAGMNFFNGNNRSANGTHRVPDLFARTQADDPVEQNQVYRAYAQQQLGRRLSASEASAYWFGRGVEFVREAPLQWLWLTARKFLLFVNADELWNNRSYEVTSQFSWVLRLPLLGFGMVAPLGILGLGLTWRSWRRLLPLYGILLVYLATSLAFFVLSRYRLPIVPVLLVLGGHAVVWLYDMLRERRWRKGAGAVPALAVIAAVVHLDVFQEDLSVAYYNLGNKYLSLKEWDFAAAQYDRSLAIDDGYISAHNNRAVALEASGCRWDEAVAAWTDVLGRARSRNLDRYVEIATRHLASMEAAGPTCRSPEQGDEGR